MAFSNKKLQPCNDLYTVLPDEVNRCNAKKGRGFAKTKYIRVRTI